jgi:hypothetical protein
MVGRAVAVRLLACTGADAAAAQMTCPQEGDRHGEPVERWTLAGDPTLGAVVRYLGHQEFGVTGRFVMVLQGQDQTYFPQVDAAAYDAYVLWTGSRLEVLRVVRVVNGPRVPRPALASDGLALAAARAAFDACAQPAQSTTVEGCPPSRLPACGLDAVQSKVSWNQDASAMVTYDSTRGIAHVAGRYGMNQTATSATPGCPAVLSARTWGAYDLWMVWESDRFVVVDTVYRQAGPGY